MMQRTIYDFCSESMSYIKRVKILHLEKHLREV